jgi:hypothetical protein
MMTGKEYLKEHIGETNIPEEHYENEIGEIMDWYADDYHQEQVKNLSLSGVSHQRELLIDFCTKLELKAKQYSYLIPDEDFIDEYLKDN